MAEEILTVRRQFLNDVAHERGEPGPFDHLEAASMSHTKERVEHVQLLQRLNRGNEKPGTTILRALRLANLLNDKEAVITAGINALKMKYPHDLAFAKAGFTIGVVETVVDCVFKPVE